MKTSHIGEQNGQRSARYEKLYAMLLDGIPSSVLLINRDLRIVSANRNFLVKNRRSDGDIVGRRLPEVFPAVILDNMDIAGRIRQVFEENQPTKGEHMTYRAPGIPLRIYYYRILPFSWQGTVELAMLLMEDVTEQERLSEEVRQMERHLASVVESASDIVLSTDGDGRILTWNTAAVSVSGYAFEEVTGRFFHEFCAPEHQDDLRRVFLELKEGRGSWMAEWEFIRKDGTHLQVSWVCSPMKMDRQSSRMGIVAVGRDLTERRKLEMQLIQSQKLAALGVMAGGIAHEIRNPLAISYSCAQFLFDDDISQEFRRECTEKIHAGIRRASTIIENLLRFARPSAKTDMGEVDLIPLIMETAALVANQARIQKVELETSFPEARVLIRGIDSPLQQVFMNIFLNAMDAMPEGGVLSVAVEEQSGEVLVRVADSGVGIEEDELDKIFDPFYTRSSTGRGTGLGLSICYSIVKEHLGSIQVESSPGKGSNFIVRLPVI
jgi:PAS domain S-box-containing protein